MAGSKLTDGEIMTEENQTGPQADEAAPDQQVQMRIEKVYLKDVSFESPKSPEVFTRQWQPNLSVDINTRATTLPDDRHEVVLSITIRAQVDEDYLGFLVEVQQAGIFYIKNADPGQLSQIVGIAGPTTLFPYAREAVDNLATKASFPALMLAQVNFDALYAQKVQQVMEQQKAEQGEAEAAE